MSVQAGKKMRPVNDDEVVHALRQRVRKRGANKVLAIDIGVHHTAITLMKNGTAPVSPRVAAALGYELVWRKREDSE